MKVQIKSKYELTCHDRAFAIWWSILHDNKIRDDKDQRPIYYRVDQLYREKVKGAEYPYANVPLFGTDWLGNSKTFNYVEARIEMIPIQKRAIDIDKETMQPKPEPKIIGVLDRDKI